MAVTLPITLVNGVVPVAEDFMANYLALKAAIDALQVTGSVIPPGIIKGFGGPVVPTGWLTCDGAAVSRASFSGLFAAIGTTWGVGDGTTTFNLPDLRGRVPIGAGVGTGLSSRTLAALLGEETHALTVAETPAHTHTPLAGGAFVTNPGFGGFGLIAGAVINPTDTLSFSGGNAAHNNMPPSAVIQWVIKT